MQRFVLCFVTGILLLTQLVELPDQRWCFLMLPIAVLAWWCWSYLRNWIWLCGLPAGFLFALFNAHGLAQHSLPHALQGIDLVVVGKVLQVPERRGGDLRFTFLLESWESVPENMSATFTDNMLRRVNLSWYRNAPQLRAGDTWQLTIRLKRPHGSMNLGGRDREKFLFHQGIHATGYVRDGKPEYLKTNILISQPHFSFNRFRQDLASKISKTLPQSSVIGPVLALTLGQRDQMTVEQWDTFRATGTSHLMAISGLHIGLISGMLFWIVCRCWAYAPGWCLRVPAPKAAAIAAIIGALLYAAMSGFAIPAQRASIMVAVVSMAVLLDRKLSPSYVLSFALLVILLFDCFSVLSAGLWMSFAAVVILMFSLSRAVGSDRGVVWKIWHWSKLQLLLVAALLPLSIWFFQQSSIISPLVNMIAIPVIGLLVVPLLLCGALMLVIIPPLGGLLLNTGNWLLEKCVNILQWAGESNAVVLTLPQPDGIVLMLALVGVATLLLPGIKFARFAGLVLLLPLLLNRPPGVPEGAFRVDVLDVGQGSAYVIQTLNHVLVYDPGPKYGEDYNAGSAVVTPFLHARGVREIDKLIISHADNDHIGGLQGVLESFKVGEIALPAPADVPELDANACSRYQQWQWDDIEFTVLNPVEGFRHDKKNRNNGSCVLMVSGPNARMLFTADIEKGSERTLMAQQFPLQAEVMTVPHHGSKTSSTRAFVAAVNPELAIVSAGYRNSFGHPKPEVLERYQAESIEVSQTVRTGMLTLLFEANGEITRESYRERRRRYWHRG